MSETEETEAFRMYDFEDSLRQLARARMRRDSATTTQTRLADLLAASAASHFGPEAVETVGLALIYGSGSLAVMIEAGLIRPEVLANILGFAGQRLVLDARAAEEGT